MSAIRTLRTPKIWTGGLPVYPIHPAGDLVSLRDLITVRANRAQHDLLVHCNVGTPHNAVYTSDGFTGDGFAGGPIYAIRLSCGHWDVDDSADLAAAR